MTTKDIKFECCVVLTDEEKTTAIKWWIEFIDQWFKHFIDVFTKVEYLNRQGHSNDYDEISYKKNCFCWFAATSIIISRTNLFFRAEIQPNHFTVRIHVFTKNINENISLKIQNNEKNCWLNC